MHHCVLCGMRGALDCTDTKCRIMGVYPPTHDRHWPLAGEPRVCDTCRANWEAACRLRALGEAIATAVPFAVERERCALIAERGGRPDLAALIREPQHLTLETALGPRRDGDMSAPRKPRARVKLRQDAWTRTTLPHDEDSVSRPLGCECHWEIGDAPCPVHGYSDE